MTYFDNNIKEVIILIKRYIALFIISIGIVFVSFNLMEYLYTYKKNGDLKRNLAENIIDDSYFLNVNFDKLLSINPDTVGFIKIDNTNISYPIVDSNDNIFYLNHSFDKKYNQAGSIFLDYRNDLDKLSKNNIIYGHGRLDNTMFGSLKDILTEEWLENKDNYYIKVTTPSHKMIFKIFSAYTILKESYYIKTYFSNTKYFKEFLETIMKRSVYNFGTDVNTTDKILTLSTCKDNFGMRIVVHAKLLKLM